MYCSNRTRGGIVSVIDFKSRKRLNDEEIANLDVDTSYIDNPTPSHIHISPLFVDEMNEFAINDYEKLRNRLNWRHRSNEETVSLKEVGMSISELQKQIKNAFKLLSQEQNNEN